MAEERSRLYTLKVNQELMLTYNECRYTWYGTVFEAQTYTNYIIAKPEPF